MPREQSPPTPVPDGLVPAGGMPYRVKTGDTLVSVAKANGLEEWFLNEFNWKTGNPYDPAVVNWYLREYVGCTVPTHDKANWTFTSGLTGGRGVWKGGVIYLPPKPSPVSNKFKIRLLGGFGGGPEVEASALFFQIWDYQNSVTAYYTYTGFGISVGLPVSVTLKGDWNDFTTSQPISVTDFAGPARFTTSGAGMWTKNYLDLLGTPKGVDQVYLSMKTGFTLGIGAGTTAGYFFLRPQEALPFKGHP